MLLSGKIKVGWYILADWCSAAISWFLFYGLRKKLLFENSPLSNWLTDSNLFKGLIFIPLFWVVLYYIIGFYHSLYKKSRLNEINKLFFVSVSGTIILFFLFILDDHPVQYQYYGKAILVLFLLHFCCTALFRFLLLTLVKWQIATGRVYFPSLIIGNKDLLHKIVKESKKIATWSGYRITGFLSNDTTEIPGLQYLGAPENIVSVIAKEKPAEVIIGFSENEKENTKAILAAILGKNLSIKLVPHAEDFLTGAIKSNDILHTGLLEIKNVAMPEWQQNIKRIIDILLSLILLIVLSPLILYIALRTKWSSKGSILFKQERLGQHEKPFLLYKFRSMVPLAEPDGPKLSSDFDARITPWGKTMRKWRLDELPQFYNILCGQMSFVGPRPERDFFAKQILAVNPYYKLLYEIKPGLTSWGMVKFGYAENIDQMIERMQFDLLYANNASLLLDGKILLHTLRILFLGKGK